MLPVLQKIKIIKTSNLPNAQLCFHRTSGTERGSFNIPCTPFICTFQVSSPVGWVLTKSGVIETSQVVVAVGGAFDRQLSLQVFVWMRRVWRHSDG